MRPGRPTPNACGALAAFAFLAAAPVFLEAPDALAVPLRVRAQSRVSVRVTRRPDGLVLRGRLADDRDRGLEGEDVHASVAGLADRTVRTGDDGQFELLITARDVTALAATRGDRVDWTLTYAGTATYGPATGGGVLDLRREPAWVALEIDPAVTTLDTDTISIRVGLEAASGPVGRVALQLAVADGPELVGDTDLDGQVVFLLRPDALERAGRFTVRAAWAGDHRFAPADAVATLRVLRPTRLTLRVGREGDLRTGRYRFSGRLSDDAGAVAGATVALVARRVDGVDDDGGVRSETLAITDDEGVYLVAIDARRFARGPAGTLDLHAVYQPTDGVHGGSTSRAARIPLPGPPGVPLSWYLAAVAASLGLVLLALAIRLRFWRELLAMARRWRHRPRSRPAEETSPTLVIEPATGADLRVDWVAGRVVDAHTGRGVVGVRLALTPEGDELDPDDGLTAAAGRFAIGPLTPGTWRLTLTRAGYMPRHTGLCVPHDGALDGATLALVSARGRVRDVFGRALGRLQVPFRWGVDTPTEATVGLELNDPAVRAAIEALKDKVEQVWFAQARADVADARDAERLLSELDEPGAAP